MPISEYIRSIRAKIGTDLLLVVGAAGVVMNDTGEILLHRRSDNGLWSLPGGSIDPGEEPADTVVREVWEETGVEVVPERIVSVTGGLDHLAEYPNGDRIAIVSVAFLCRPVGGMLHINDDESLEVRYFAPDALPDLEPRHLLRIQAALRNDLRAHFRVNNSNHKE
jgi:8-oxo-dGTP diphosphatase